jgi:multiple antibiotic resistance protein
MNFDQLLLAFVPLFVAIDALGLVPMLLGMTDGMENHERKKLVTTSALVALVVAVIFVLGGQFIFHIIGITVDDFRVAGGILLLVLSIYDVLFSQQERRSDSTMAGVVPIGIPLTIGPAAMATLLILVKTYGYTLTFISLFLNVLIAWLCYSNCHLLVKVLGRSGSKAYSKVMSLFMAGFAIMMIRIGILGMIGQFS